MIKAVIFDCFGVLTGDKWKEYVGSLQPELREPARALNRSLDAGKFDAKVFYQKIHELTGDPVAKVEGVINAEMDKNEPLLDYIAELKKSHKIGMLSNVSSDWVRHFLTGSELALFDDLVLSFEVKMTKHDPKIFHLTADRLNLKTSECVLLDDTVPHVELAKREGMEAIVYHDFTQAKAELEKILIKM